MVFNLLDTNKSKRLDDKFRSKVVLNNKHNTKVEVITRLKSSCVYIVESLESNWIYYYMVLVLGGVSQ